MLGESDYGDHAARAWFEVVNQTNQELLVEIDYGRIAVIDSYGRRFGDWDGGGLYAVTLEAGETQSFNRYYSDRSGSRSRVSRGAHFVVNALYVLTLDSYAETLVWLGERGAAQCRQESAAIREARRTRCWSPQRRLFTAAIVWGRAAARVSVTPHSLPAAPRTAGGHRRPALRR